MTENSSEDPKGPESDTGGIEAFLERKAKMEAEFHSKFTKRLAVMFTDLKGSTSIAEDHGDLSARMLIKDHNDIVFPAIAQNGGTLVKTIGDGTLSYFESPLGALRAACQMQKGMDGLNMSQKYKMPVLIRVGIHTGDVIFEEKDIFGDVVNTASRFESSSNAGEISISEETYNALEDKGEIYCRMTKTITLKGKKEPVNVYKAYWNEQEIAADKYGAPRVDEKSAHASSKVKVALALIVPLVLILLLVFANKYLTQGTEPERRSVVHTTE